MLNKSMFISHGFALHITWDATGRGRDQFNNIWYIVDEMELSKGGAVTITESYAVDENNIYKFKLSEG